MRIGTHTTVGRISVVITSFNQKVYLQEAIESVLNQTLELYEIIICDDASTDGSREVIECYEQRYPGLVKAVLQRKNIGVSGNRSSGLERAEGDLVSWLDGDDRFKPRKLELELKTFLRDPGVRWVYSQVEVVNENGKKLRLRYDEPPEGYIFNDVVKMLGRAPRNQLVNMQALSRIGFWKEDMCLYEDFELCLRLAKNYKTAYCPQPLVEYRIHPFGIHNVAKKAHIDNFGKLFRHFQEMISDYPIEQRSELEKLLLHRISVVSGQEVDFRRVKFAESWRKFFARFLHKSRF